MVLVRPARCALHQRRVVDHANDQGHAEPSAVGEARADAPPTVLDPPLRAGRRRAPPWGVLAGCRHAARIPPTRRQPLDEMLKHPRGSRSAVSSAARPACGCVGAAGPRFGPDFALRCRSAPLNAAPRKRFVDEQPHLPRRRTCARALRRSGPVAALRAAANHGRKRVLVLSTNVHQSTFEELHDQKESFACLIGTFLRLRSKKKTVQVRGMRIASYSKLPPRESIRGVLIELSQILKDR